jgi:hypothetical protein
MARGATQRERNCHRGASAVCERQPVLSAATGKQSPLCHSGIATASPRGVASGQTTALAMTDLAAVNHQEVIVVKPEHLCYNRIRPLCSQTKSGFAQRNHLHIVASDLPVPFQLNIQPSNPRSASPPMYHVRTPKNISHGTRYMGSEQGASSPQKHAHMQPQPPTSPTPSAACPGPEIRADSVGAARLEPGRASSSPRLPRFASEIGIGLPSDLCRLPGFAHPGKTSEVCRQWTMQEP